MVGSHVVVGRPAHAVCQAVRVAITRPRISPARPSFFGVAPATIWIEMNARGFNIGLSHFGFTVFLFS